MRVRKLPFAAPLMLLSACTMTTPVSSPTPAARSTPTGGSTPAAQSKLASRTGATINLDAETQALIDSAERVVFVVPFSHWDTDWHDTFAAYAPQADRNILDAIELAKQYPRFRYSFEQVLFVQHFWDTYPEHRADLLALLRKRQLTFAWGGITQPETSLTAPATQVRNLQRGQDWIAQTFGPAYVPHTAWQSDAFGNSAALPILLQQLAIPYLFIGRWQHRCDPDYDDCTPLPHLFQWASPADPTQRVLVAYQNYSQPFGTVQKLADEDAQLAAIGQIVAGLAELTDSKYLFLPFGDDFWSLLPNLPTLVDRWNAADRATVLMMADPETAFDHLATQPLPQITVDLNPIWQAFFGTRPAGKIADKESEYYLTAADKFGVLLHTRDGSDMPQSSAWYTATVNAHYDNISAVGYDRVSEASQRPRFEQTVATAADDLSRTLAHIASAVPAPVVVFNPTSCPRSGVVELHERLPDVSLLPAAVQRLGPYGVAFWVENVPPVGYRAPPKGEPQEIEYPATATQDDQQVMLSNGLVSLTLDSAHGGTFSQLALAGGPPFLATFGDDVTYIDDGGDVYGAFFGAERARERAVPARIAIMANGPLIARARVLFELGGQPITKTVTLQANSPQIDVALEIAALPETTAVVQTPTTRATTTRTDDLGFAAFEHPVDNSPIISGTITYRREVFYPITSWGNISAAGAGLTLITHGLQGLGGTSTLNLMLVRQVSDPGSNEGVTDAGYHTLRYAYLPHTGTAGEAEPWLAAYAFNQPLIPVWQSEGQVQVQLPCTLNAQRRSLRAMQTNRTFPPSFSIISATSGLVADLYRRNDRIEALIFDYEATTPATITSGGEQHVLGPAALTVTEVDVK